MGQIIATVEFKLDAETKNMVRYAEDGSAHIRTLYLSKDTVAQPYPPRIEVTVRVSNHKKG